MLINFAILYRVLNKYASKPILNALEKRKTLMDKLENADQEYADMIAKAKEESQNIIADGMKHKNDIINEAKTLAEKTRDGIIENGHKEADKITKNAEHKAKLLEEDLTNKFADGVKSTTEVVVKKLIQKDTAIQSDYLDTLIKEVTTS